MDENREKILGDLASKVEKLSMQQQKLSHEIRELREEIRNVLYEESTLTNEQIKPATPVVEMPIFSVSPPEPVQQPRPVNIQQKPVAPTPSGPKVKTPIEEFIGTNLLNKIGIAIVVIGVGIGAKYAIDNNLITKLERSILGYLSGLILIGLAIRLKPKHAAFSAVLLSGGMAVLYFMTYVAYADYELIPQPLAFVLMVLFTAFTVYASLQYNMKVIAIIGLVGAYAVPFLLSDGSGRVAILFSYMVLINAGILVLSFKKAWKALYYTAFGLTWLIFMVWFFDRYDNHEHLWISLGFSTIFFVTFYTSFLSYKLVQQESLKVWDIVLLLLNSFIYYGFGYATINTHENGEMFLGLFTVFNAILHFIACFLIYKRQDATRDTFYLVAGMVLIFLTLAVPVQLDGQWVTIIWALEGLLLFWIGRTKKFLVYERISYAMVVLAFISLTHDWQQFYGYADYFSNLEHPDNITFLFNIQVLSALLICAAWGTIIYFDRQYQTEKPADVLTRIFQWVIPVLVILVLYVTFSKEIDTYWQQRYYASGVETRSDDYTYNLYDEDLQHFGSLSLMIYTSLFTMALVLINRKWIRNEVLTHATTILSVMVLLTFITGGIYALYSLRSSYLDPQHTEYYYRDFWHIAIRYISMITVLPLLLIIYQNVRSTTLPPVMLKVERLFFHFILLTVLSSELISVLDMARIEDSDRLALSILWAVYALALIVYGLKKDEKFIRITAFVIFGITLLKLFFYDLAEMSTIAKTMVMVIVGAILLIASFIYNKFKAARHDS